MTTKRKIVVAISALVILSGAGYLVYKFLIKPNKDKKEPVAPVNTETSTANTNTSSDSVVTPPPLLSSKYGFKPGEKLYAKSNTITVYSYPDTAVAKNYIGFIQKSAISNLTFASDANTNGWIKAVARYISKDGSGKENVGNVYVLATTITNIAP